MSSRVEDCTTCKHFDLQPGTWKISKKFRCGVCIFIKVKNMWEKKNETN